MNEKLTVVKAEIKHWEHTFKAKNGHEPTRDDIKADPTIAEKYRLYNKLKKESQGQINDNHKSRIYPRTPSPTLVRSHKPSATIIASKASPAASAVSLDTKNPFSPHKKKNVPPSNEPVRTVWNPFMTPIKGAPVRACTPSPPPQLIICSKPPNIAQITKQYNATLSKARKRLRGDSVSPSPPQRDKYIGSAVNSALMGRSSSIHKKENDDVCIEESPVKPTANGKSFQPLFNDISSQSATATSTGHGGKTFKKTKTEPGGLFGTIKNAKNDTKSDVFGNADTLAKRQGKAIHEDAAAMPVNKRRKTMPGPKGLIPSKDNLFEEKPTSDTNPPPPSSSRKRTISKVTRENADKPKESNEWNLLPPSPPPQEEKSWNKANLKGKKQKVVEKAQHTDVEDDESDAETDNVYIVNWHEANTFRRKDDDSGWEIDPELRIQLRLGATGTQDEYQSPEPEIFEVDLPEEMQKMLYLSPREKKTPREDENLVKSVIQGRRRGGAEVWGPGELGGESEGSGEGTNQGADDWEGEGVPWEVGEL